MKKFTLLASLILAGVALTGCTNLTEVGQIGNVKIYRATARGVFSPALTTFIASPEHAAQPSDLDTLSSAGGPGVFPAAANAGGTVGAAVLLRPARTTVDASTTSTTDIKTGSSTVTANGGTGGFIPPGQVDNPGHTK